MMGSVLTGLVALITAATLVAAWYTLRLRERVRALEKQLDIYVETSIAVARSVDQVIFNRTSSGAKPTASRRYLLQEARRRIESGQSLAQVREDLVLMGDEADLLVLGAKPALQPLAESV